MSYELSGLEEKVVVITGAPAEIRHMVAFLCSEQGEWISGQFYSVDGGQLAGT